MDGTEKYYKIYTLHAMRREKIREFENEVRGACRRFDQQLRRCESF
jgi:hypothetical protein